LASGTRGRQGVCIEASVTRMVVSNDVGDAALVAVVDKDGGLPRLVCCCKVEATVAGPCGVR
jgi:hypothetical protein